VRGLQSDRFHLLTTCEATARKTGRKPESKEVEHMPWAADDAERHTKKADTAKRQRMWSEIANSVLTDTGDEGRAIREANAAVAKDYAKSNNTVRASQTTAKRSAVDKSR
jgi:hypothetical protein